MKHIRFAESRTYNTPIGARYTESFKAVNDVLLLYLSDFTFPAYQQLPAMI